MWSKLAGNSEKHSGAFFSHLLFTSWDPVVQLRRCWKRPLRVWLRIRAGANIIIAIILIIIIKKHCQWRLSQMITSVAMITWKGRLAPPKHMNFRESSKGGSHFQSKNLCCRSWTFKQGFLSMKFEEKNCNMIFRKWGGGGSKAVWNILENSFLLLTPSVPKPVKSVFLESS